MTRIICTSWIIRIIAGIACVACISNLLSRMPFIISQIKSTVKLGQIRSEMCSQF